MKDSLVRSLIILNSVIPLVIPIIAILIGWRIWLYFARLSSISKIEWTTLEIRIPREVFKSPLAMELVINAMYQTFPTDWYKRYIKGLVRSWFSLEIVSIEGNVYFFMHIPKFFKSFIESQIYSQYPQAEINDVEDYTKHISPYNKEWEWKMFGSEFKLTKPDPYPIKTYVDYGLDKAVGSLKEEERVDPITPTLEFLGSLGPGEQIWIQILIRATMKKTPKKGSWFGKNNWKDEGKELISEMKAKHESSEDKPATIMPKDEQDIVNAIDRSINKTGFDCGIRAIYLAKKDNFNNLNMSAMLGVFKQYSSNSLNGLAPYSGTMTGFRYPWQDPTGVRKSIRIKKMFNAYRLRSYFNPPHKRVPFVLNTEELATIYHFPGRVSETPSFKRVDSKKAEPPSNLPV